MTQTWIDMTDVFKVMDAAGNQTIERRDWIGGVLQEVAFSLAERVWSYTQQPPDGEAEIWQWIDTAADQLAAVLSAIEARSVVVRHDPDLMI